MEPKTSKDVVKISIPSLTKRTVRNVLWTIKTTVKTIGFIALSTLTFSMLGLGYYYYKIYRIATIYDKADKNQKSYILKEILEKNTNPFSIIESPITSSQSEIKKNFRKASFKYHPDKNKNTDGSEIRKINNAMEFLRLKESSEMVKLSKSLPKTVRDILVTVIEESKVTRKKR